VWAQVVHAFGEIDRLCTLLETERITHASQMTKLRLQNHEIAAEVSNILLTYIHYYMLLSCMHDASSTLIKLEAQKWGQWLSPDSPPTAMGIQAMGLLIENSQPVIRLPGGKMLLAGEKSICRGWNFLTRYEQHI
jgi:hypothetical protein